MPTFKITLAYDGTDFVGWQRQANGTSIQGLLEDALSDLDGRKVVVTGAGRTDAGVHALGQVAGCSLDRAITGAAVTRALNARLPADIRVLSAAEVPPQFHARFNARAKTYRYRIWNADVLSPFERRYVWHVEGALDVAGMDGAARLLEGHHDFAAFRAAGGTTRTTERTMTASRVDRRDRLVVYETTGDGFLRYMVRAIVGTLVEIGRGRQPPAWMGDVLGGRDRARAGPTAPPEGLFLVRVDYE
ncbi:MAG: tRNA pseudouridine(38-40) synthase TruA [Vicinamibacterales bacterium]